MGATSPVRAYADRELSAIAPERTFPTAEMGGFLTLVVGAITPRQRSTMVALIALPSPTPLPSLSKW